MDVCGFEEEGRTNDLASSEWRPWRALGMGVPATDAKQLRGWFSKSSLKTEEKEAAV